MKKTVIYVHGKGGSAAEAEHYIKLFPDCRVVGFDYQAQTPWEAKNEFPAFFEKQREEIDSVTLAANSIGAFFSMSSLSKAQVDRAFFISPVVNMEKLITDMMMWAGVDLEELREKGEIPTDFGETLSWEYLCYVRENPVTWDVPTHILYGERDRLTSYVTVKTFAQKIGASVTVMPQGEHWFHLSLIHI